MGGSSEARRAISKLMVLEKYQCSLLLLANLGLSFLNDLGVLIDYHFILAYIFSFGFYPCLTSLVVARYFRKCWWEYASIFGLITANIMGVLYFHFNAYEVFIDLYSTFILLSVTVIVTFGMLKESITSVRREK